MEEAPAAFTETVQIMVIEQLTRVTAPSKNFVNRNIFVGWRRTQATFGSKSVADSTEGPFFTDARRTISSIQRIVAYAFTPVNRGR